MSEVALNAGYVVHYGHRCYATIYHHSSLRGYHSETPDGDSMGLDHVEKAWHLFLVLCSLRGCHSSRSP